MNPENVTLQVALKEYLDLRFQDPERRVMALEVIVENIRQGYMTEEQYSHRHEALADRVATIERWQANILGRYVGMAVVGAILVSVIAAFASHVISS